MSWLNIFGLIIVVLMLIPNTIYAYRNKNLTNQCTSRLLNGLEQVGRYGSMFLMVFNIGILEFGFRSDNGFAIWLIVIAVLLLTYWGGWLVYAKKRTLALSLLLAIVPSLIFVLSGVLLRHWLLVASGCVFALGHICVTDQNAKKSHGAITTN